MGNHSVGRNDLASVFVALKALMCLLINFFWIVDGTYWLLYVCEVTHCLGTQIAVRMNGESFVESGRWILGIIGPYS